MRRLSIISLFMLMALSSAAQAPVIIKGATKGTVLFSSEKSSGSITFSSSGKEFVVKAIRLSGAMDVSVSWEGRSQTLFSGGRPYGSDGSREPKIGFQGATESQTNIYQIIPYDFSDDGNPEIVVAVSDGGDGIGVYVFSFDGAGWRSVGRAVTCGKGLGGCRIFRQALTLKGTDGTMYSWTWHGGHFDFLSSDPSATPSALY